MVFILDGNSEIGAHVWSKFRNLICPRHFFISRALTNLIFFFKIELFSVLSAQHVLSYQQI